MKLTIKELFEFWWHGVIRDSKMWKLAGIVFIITIVGGIGAVVGTWGILESKPGKIFGGFGLLVITTLFNSIITAQFFSLIASSIGKFGDEFISRFKQVPLGAIWSRFPVVMGILAGSIVIILFWIGVIMLGLALGGVDINGVNGPQIANPLVGAIYGALVVIYLSIYLYVAYGKFGATLMADGFKKSFFTLISTIYDVNYLKRSFNVHYLVNSIAIFGAIVLISIAVAIVIGLIKLLVLFLLLKVGNNQLLAMEVGMVMEMIGQVIANLLTMSLVAVGATFAHLSTLGRAGDTGKVEG
jgi:hypothetical protein